MIVRTRIHFVVHLILVIPCVAYPFLVVDLSRIFALISFCILITYYFTWVLTQKRTFVLDKNGCTVKFWKYKKTYKWDEFKTKQIEARGYYYGKNIRYQTTVIFYAKKHLNPNSHAPSSRAYLHPLSYIFIHFEDEGDKYSSKIYEVDRHIFFEKLEEWGVTLEKVCNIK